MKDRASSGRTWTYPQRCWRTRRALVARLGPSTTHTFTCQAARRTVARTSVGAGEGWIATFGRTSRTAARALRSRGSSIHPRIWPARPPGAAIAGSAQPDGLLRRHFSRFGSGSEYPIGFRSFGRGTRSGAPVRIVTDYSLLVQVSKVQAVQELLSPHITALAAEPAHLPESRVVRHRVWLHR